MGRGLSETQKRILVWAHDRFFAEAGGAQWFDGCAQWFKPVLAQAILDREGGTRKLGDYASVSRALQRLESRGLIVRIPHVDYRGKAGKRTSMIRLTPSGREVVLKLKAPSP